MERNYTEDVREGFFDLIENDLTDIWDSLGNRKQTIAEGKWKQHYQQVISKYKCSCRFALMRILFEKATRLPYYRINEDDLREGFSVNGIGDFRDISISHALQMNKTELLQYKQLMLQRVDDHDPSHLSEAGALIDKALSLSSDRLQSPISRAELLSLGHLMDFSLDDMQFMLLRVLGDNEAGFVYSSSSDVIDMYGYICGADLDTIEELRSWYTKKTSRQKKVSYEDKPVYCTQDIADSLEETFREMTLDEFKSWLLERAPMLDIKSKTARKVYLNLAVYTYLLCHPSSYVPEDILVSDDFYGDIDNIAGLREYGRDAVQMLFKSGQPDASKCKNIARALIYENAEHAAEYHSHTENSEFLYHVPYLENGKITVRGKLNKNSMQRIIDILMDAESPTKSDMLYLLWLSANCQWLQTPTSDKEKAIFLDDFLSAASCVLRAALLPDFYPPNVLEETMMLGIVYGDEDLPPAAVYESICSEFTQKGSAKKPAGSLKKDPAFRKAVAEWVYTYMDDNPGKSLTAAQEACSAYYTADLNCKVSYSSVRNYCKEYPRK